MARLAGWRPKEVLEEITTQAIANANAAMDEVVELARRLCPVSPIYRPGKWRSGTVAFTPKTGRNKGREVRFWAEKIWMGRAPGDLRDTIRRVSRHDRKTNIRVYAGTYKIYWAHMVERGTSKTPMQAFLRPAWMQLKNGIPAAIKHGVIGRAQRAQGEYDYWASTAR